MIMGGGGGGFRGGGGGGGGLWTQEIHVSSDLRFRVIAQLFLVLVIREQ